MGYCKYSGSLFQTPELAIARQEYTKEQEKLINNESFNLRIKSIMNKELDLLEKRLNLEEKKLELEEEKLQLNKSIPKGITFCNK